jgi:hypothetical protein
VKNLKSDNIKGEFSLQEKIHRRELRISKIGIVARDYRESNGNSDFSKNIIEILDYLEEKGCDSVLFSLFAVMERNSLTTELLERKSYKNLKSLFIEEFKFENKERHAKVFKVYHKQKNDWNIFEFTQKFGRLQYTKKFNNEIMVPFIEEVKTHRIMGNTVVLLCGETNIVKYSKKTRQISDDFNFLDTITDETNIVLNPIHDKMTRFEMKLKRQFLSMDNRVVVSVWNKGKTFLNGQTRDGLTPPWTIYFKGQEKIIDRENLKLKENKSKIDVGILDLEKILKNTKA